MNRPIDYSKYKISFTSDFDKVWLQLKNARDDKSKETVDKVYDIIKRLMEYGIIPDVIDPWVDTNDVCREYGFHLINIAEVKDADCIIFAVAHDQFKELTMENIMGFYNSSADDTQKVLIDVKGIFNMAILSKTSLRWWRL